MAPKPPLTPSEVMEVMRLSERGATPQQIAPQFGRTDSTIRKILTGATHRDVTGRNHKANGKFCDCYICILRARQDANLLIVDRAECPVHCQLCDCWVSRRVADVLHTHGRVLCDDCDGRR